MKSGRKAVGNWGREIEVGREIAGRRDKSATDESKVRRAKGAVSRARTIPGDPGGARG